MTDEELKQAMAELQEVVRCRCDEAYRDRGLHDPQCECDSADAVKVVADHIKALTAKLAKAVEALEQIARPKVGPDFDWTEDETNKWRAVWYRKYQDIARATLAEIKGESHD